MCKGITMISLAILLILGPHVVHSTAANCTALAESGDCEFYPECVQAKVDCDTDADYPMAYAYKYCTKFDELYDDFTSEGQQWVDDVRVCLMKALLGPIHRPGISCAQLTDIAYDSHVECYLNSGPGFCDVALTDFDTLCDVYEVDDFFEKYWKQAWKQVIKTIYSCYRQQWSFANVVGIASDATQCAATKLGSFERDAFESDRRRRRRSVSVDEADVIAFAADGECEFWEALEDKFACSATHDISFGYSVLLPMCVKFQTFSAIGPSEETGDWMTRTQQCLMDHALPYYQSSSVDCLEVDSAVMYNVVDCMVDSGFCDLDHDDEFFLDRGLHPNGFPARFPKEYTKRPLSGNIEFLDSEYFLGLKWFKALLADANVKCYQQNERPSPYLYEEVYSITEGITMRFRTGL